MTKEEYDKRSKQLYYEGLRPIIAFCIGFIVGLCKIPITPPLPLGVIAWLGGGVAGGLITTYLWIIAWAIFDGGRPEAK
jgi:hypothetical protein